MVIITAALARTAVGIVLTIVSRPTVGLGLGEADDLGNDVVPDKVAYFEISLECLCRDRSVKRVGYLKTRS